MGAQDSTGSRGVEEMGLLPNFEFISEGLNGLLGSEQRP